MGHSASARLIYGVNFMDGDGYDQGVPEWLAAHSDNPEDALYSNFAALKGTGVEFILYGYKPAGSCSSALGVSLAWAVDFGSAGIDLSEVTARSHEAHPKVRAALAKLRAPMDVAATIRLHLLVSYG